DLEGEAVNLKTQLDSNTAADAATKQALETKIAAIEALITILQTKDTELDGKIAALQAYVNSEITATKDWATATFATLAQYQAVLNDIADINLLVEQNKTAIEDITNDLASMQTAIDNLHTSMQTWVNEQLQEPLADIATLQADLTNLSNSVATDQELATAIAEQQTALDNAMNGVSQTIREAITAAIGNGGTIDLAISQKIDAAKTELQSQISTINSAITTIQDRLDKLEKRIQSIRFLPEYSDGKVKIEPGMSAVELTFIVSPKEAAAIAKEKVTAFIYHTQSRAVDAVPLTVTDVSGNATTGMLTVSVTPPAEAYWATGITANIYIQINDGNNDIISEMIPAYYDVEPDYVTFSAVSEQTLDLEQRKSPKLDEEGETVYEDDGETPVYVPDPYPEYGDDTGYIEYSVGNSNVWTKFTPGSQPVAFGGDKGDLHLRGISPKGTLKAQIVFGNNTTPVACSGDIRTLVDWKNYEAADTRSAIFYGLFENCTVLTSAPELPATDLAEKCYWAMFWGCTSLAVAPELPATTLANSCYVNMFHGCAKLTEAPELPATILANGCYNGMFMDCTSLTSAPELPATNLAEYCYSSMFSGCTSLVTAPELPATTLVDNCYTCMFMNCTSLTSAPALPATTLKTGCYFQMFRHCTSLNSVTMLATDTDISATNCLTDWLEDVADTGTFTKAASMTSLPRDIHGIPSGWTVENYGESEN
ncbi:MAG: leucine-rich repeat protein, partial [Bacteroides sp.]|nr:leucine-rich repeat protein [Bacteroides sp.]